MTEKEKIIATAYTGIAFVAGEDLDKLYEYAEEKVGFGVLDFLFADKEFVKELRTASRQDFIDMLAGKFSTEQ